MCHTNVTHVKTTTIRELRHDTTKVLSWVAAGQSVEVRRRNQPVAVLSPPARRRIIRRPDFGARLRSIYGRTTLKTTGTDLVSASRGDS